MTGYVPGEQPAAGQRVVKLNTNEAAFPPSDAVLEAIRNVSAEDLRRYPDPRATKFRQAVADRFDVPLDMVIAGNGSDDILTIVTRAYVPPGGRVAAPWPTYSLYPTLCQIQGSEFVGVDWNDGWSLPTDDLLKTKADAIYLANPNAPSGTVVPIDEIADLATRHKGLLLIDEAYADYADGHCVELSKQHKNVIVSRTLSKGYALAGLRLGYAIADAEVMQELDKVRDSYNVDVVAQAVGIAAIRDDASAERLWSHVRDERKRLTHELEQLDFYVELSHANFVLAKREDAQNCFEALKANGVLVRYWDKPELSQYIRITVGTTAENNAVIACLKQMKVLVP